MIDSHCHLADETYAGDLDAVVARAKEAEIEGSSLKPFPSTPPELLLRSRVLPVFRSRRKTSSPLFVSPPTKFVALEA